MQFFILSQVDKLLTVGLAWLIKNLLCLILLGAWFFNYVLEVASYLATFNDVNIVCLVTLLENFTASRFDFVLELLVEHFELLEAKIFKRRDAAEIFYHLVLSSFTAI